MKRVSARIKKFNAPLLPDKVKLKYQLMCESMFRFYRGTCHLFYEDPGKMKQKMANGCILKNSDSPYHYKVKDVVFRLAGTGSVGVERYLFLLRNPMPTS